MNSTSPLAPPDGYYAVPDIGGAALLTHWKVEGRSVSEWPIGAKYGPVRPPYMPDLNPEVRRARMAAWRSARRDYLVMVYDAICADPRGAAEAFTRWTGRCQTCRASLAVEDCQPDTGKADSQATADTLASGARAAADRIVTAATQGSVGDVTQLLDGADPAVVITRLSAVIGTLAGVR